MRNKFTGPYQITGMSSNGQHYLKDIYSHQLKRPVPANQVVCYSGVGGFCRESQNVDVENCENHLSDEIGAAAPHSHSILDNNGTELTLTVYQMRLVVWPLTLRVSQMILVLHLTLRVFEII